MLYPGIRYNKNILKYYEWLRYLRTIKYIPSIGHWDTILYSLCVKSDDIIYSS